MTPESAVFRVLGNVSDITLPPGVAPTGSDDALLDQVDEQVSVAVPSSMESLTHLVSTGSNSSAASSERGSRHLVQTN